MTTDHSTDSTCVPENPADKAEVMKTVTDLLSQGKRSMVCGEIPQAVNLYEEAVQLLVKSCGELSRDCADAYFCCGSALLELGRMETNVLGVALEGVDVEEEKDVESSEQFEKPPEDDGEERHKLREDVYEAMAEGEREEELHKCVQDKTGAAGVGNCNTTTEVTGMETDQTQKCGGGTDPTQSTDADSQAESGTQKCSTITTSSSSGQQGDESTDSVAMTEHDQVVGPGQQQLVSATSEHGAEEGKGDTPATDTTQATESSNTADSTVTQADHTQQGDLDISAQENNVVKTGDDEQTDAPAQAASKELEQMDASATVSEEPKATVEKMNEESKTEHGESTEKLSQPASEQSSDQVANTVGDVEKEKCAEQIVTEAVKEACQKIADEEANSQEATVAGDGTAATGKEVDVGALPADEDADVEMADDDDAVDDADDDDVNAPSDHEDNGDEKADDVPNFQLAWEYLELAKVIYLKSESVDDQLKAAECHIKLGELSMETEQYSTAAEDLEIALKIQQKHLPATDRLIAETHYQLGLAYGLGGEYERSIQQYTTAIGVLESKIESLSQLVKNEVSGENKENAEGGELKQYQDEIKELQDLIPEIKNKVEDMRLEAQEVQQVKQMAQEAMGFPATAQEAGSVALTAQMDTTDASGDSVGLEQQASNIGHLVRKKRKPDTDLADEVQEVKKSRPDNCGDCSSEGTDVRTQDPVNEATPEIVDTSLELRADDGASTGEVEMSAVTEESEMAVTGESEMTVTGESEMTVTGESEMTVTGESEMSIDTGKFPLEPVTGEAELGAVNQVANIEQPISEQSETGCKMSETESVNTECESGAVNETSTPQQVHEEPAVSTVSNIPEPQPMHTGSEIGAASEVSTSEPVSEEPAISEVSKSAPVNEEPAVSEVSKSAPVSEEPAFSEVSKSEPVNEELAVSEVSESAPVSEEPAVSEVSKSEPVNEEPAVEVSKSEPVNEEPTVGAINESSKSEPVSEGPAASEVSESEPVSEKSAVSEVSKSELVREEPAVSEVSKSEPVREEPAVSEVSKSEPVREEPAISEVSKSELVREEPAVSEVSKSEPAGEEPAVSEVSKSEPAGEEPAVSEVSKSEPAGEEPAVSEVSKSEPAGEEPAVSEVSKSELVREEPVVSTMNKVLESEPICGESIISEASKVEVVNGSAAVSEVSKLESVSGKSEADVMCESPVIEPLNGESGVISQSSQPEPLNGQAEVCNIPESVHGENEVDMVTESGSGSVNGEASTHAVSKSAHVEPVIGEPEMDMVSEPSNTEPVNGESAMDTVNECEMEPVNGDSEMETVSASSHIEPVIGESEAFQQVAAGGDVDTLKGELKLGTVVNDSCSINCRDEVSMETESTAS